MTCGIFSLSASTADDDSDLSGSEDENGTESQKQKDWENYGRACCRLVNPFERIQAIVEHGLKHEADHDSDDESETDENDDSNEDDGLDSAYVHLLTLPVLGSHILAVYRN